ncbi:TRAP transporter 4TM/12TM fusion protein [Paenibacillus sp. PvR098]|nr:TRAP transporter 4TM/12TM fusion protein [Paenibacillus sp. PvP091]MBP1172092.1 TRAP transporter 4TM/12TM fusion protein [Paenibacillus sp. PvR098]MBP2438473.1 TRAP transporter 4TM/12TM fusion protein [Paenibacillus sp. PvP052]
MKYPLAGGKKLYLRIVDWLLIIGSVVTGLYLFFNYLEVTMRTGVPTHMDVLMAMICVVVLLEALRRCVGWGLTGIAILFLIYVFWGKYFPGLLEHRGYSLDRVSSRLYMGSGGIYGLTLATMFRYVVIFIIFGAILDKTGVSDFMIALSRAVAGRLPGGTGQVSIISSGLMGSVSGSAVANVMVGGNVTIPAMKKSGFKGTVAGAIEAVSSNGGQILPPVMGAAAFLMADHLQVPYITIALAALIPALLYLLANSAYVHFYAQKNGIHGIDKREITSIGTVLKTGWLYTVPFIVLFVMLVWGYSPSYSGLWATVAAIICGFLNPWNRLSLRMLYEAVVDSGRGVVMLSIASAGAGIVVGVLTLTGLGNRMSSILIEVANNNLMILLLLATLVSILLGMGMSTTVVYILLATTVAPALIDMGILPIAAHLFILYYGTMSTLTPPVALASYAAAAISGDSPDRTSWTAFKIAIPAYMVPYFFVFNNHLLMEGSALLIVTSVLCAVAGMILFASGMVGFYKRNLFWPERLLLAFAGLCFMTGGLWSVGVAVILLVVFYFIYKVKGSRNLLDMPS